MKNFIKQHSAILMEGAIVERLRYDPRISLHSTLVNGALVYDALGRQQLEVLYREYLDIAQAYRLPMILCTPTWRANMERVEAAGISKNINQDNARLLTEIIGSYSNIPIKIAGMLGCKNDCYKADEALDADTAEIFHHWQVNALCEAGVDFLFAATLPAVCEAEGIGRSMSKSGLPYILSFTINRKGKVLDGTLLSQAIQKLDQLLEHPPLGYMVNCAYPSFLSLGIQDKEAMRRLIGFQANASDLDQCDLDNSCEIHARPVEEWGKEMMLLHTGASVKILGGCCGTGSEHIGYLAKHLK